MLTDSRAITDADVAAETTALGPLFDLLDAGVGQVEASRMVRGAA
ncbi:MAG TPA: hypothetical protein VFH56_11155 [Acidimicrobiales bacterium]|nr:hypothetical protein [Acidimicrobiales bacterium]